MFIPYVFNISVFKISKTFLTNACLISEQYKVCAHNIYANAV